MGHIVDEEIDRRKERDVAEETWDQMGIMVEQQRWTPRYQNDKRKEWTTTASM